MEWNTKRFDGMRDYMTSVDGEDSLRNLTTYLEEEQERVRDEYEKSMDMFDSLILKMTLRRLSGALRDIK